MTLLLFLIAWIAAGVATVAAAVANATVMGVSGMIAALAALGWGFLAPPSPPARGDGSCPTCDHPFGDHSHICIGGES